MKHIYKEMLTQRLRSVTYDFFKKKKAAPKQIKLPNTNNWCIIPNETSKNDTTKLINDAPMAVCATSLVFAMNVSITMPIIANQIKKPNQSDINSELTL